MKHIKTFESFVNEATNIKMGPRSVNFDKMVDNTVVTFEQAVENEKEEDGDLPTEYYVALKTLKISEKDAAVCFSASIGSHDQMIYAADRCGLKYVVVEDSETNDSAIVFSAKQ